MPLTPRPGYRGFTLVEIAIVLMIVGVVAWISIPAYQGYIERARIREAVFAVGEMSKSIRQWEVTKGALPDSLGEIGVVGEKAKDPWGFDYEYLNLRTAKGNGQARKDKKLAPLNSDFDLYSVGRDGLTKLPLPPKESHDDVVRARNGRFIGFAKDFEP